MGRPKPAEKKRILEALLKHFENKQQAAVIRYLFEQSEARPELDCEFAKPDQALDRIVEADIQIALGKKPSAKSNVPTVMTHLFQELEAFFERHGGHYRWRIVRPRFETGKTDWGNYRLRFEPSSHAGQVSDIVTRFWRPHLEGPPPIQILYPELRCMMDVNTKTYFRNSYMDRPQVLASLGITDDRAIRNSFSMVSSGVIAGVLSVLEYLNNEHKTKIEVNIVLPNTRSVQFRTRPNIVLFATPTSTGLLTELELPNMRVGKDGVAIEQGPPYVDDEHEDRGAVMQTKYGVVTRRMYNEQLVTVIAGKHGRAVQGIAGYLTKPNTIRQLSTMSGRRNLLSGEFQALFRVQLTKATEGDPVINDIELLRVLPRAIHSKTVTKQTDQDARRRSPVTQPVSKPSAHA
jgi:hypothetical protein